MIYTYEIRESDISIDEKFIAVVKEFETVDGPYSIFDFATGNDYKALEKWAKSIVN